MPATDDEIREKYLERAIRELNALTRELQDCRALPARQASCPSWAPAIPQADVLLLKYAPRPRRSRRASRSTAAPAPR